MNVAGNRVNPTVVTNQPQRYTILMVLYLFIDRFIDFLFIYFLTEIKIKIEVQFSKIEFNPRRISFLGHIYSLFRE